MEWITKTYKIAKNLFNLPSAVIYLVMLGAFVAAAIYLATNIGDVGAYLASIAFFAIGAIISYHLSKTAGFDGALSHFKDVIIGSTSIGLISIKKLSDLPPEDIVKRTNNSLNFIGVAGGKFLKSSLDTVDFFRTNQSAARVRFVLMDPFCKDVERLTRNPIQQREYREKIIKSLIELSAKEKQGYRFEVRLYPKIPPLRLMICDGAITALSVYSLGESGWKNAQLVFDAAGCPESMAPHFCELFDDLWERSLGFNLNLRAQSLSGFLNKNLLSTDSAPVPLGMVHGRFQPFHHEHLEYVLYGITHSEKCIIGITQPYINNISECSIAPHRGKKEGNPYSFDERKDMIHLSLQALGVERARYEIVAFDIDNAEARIPELISSLGNKPVQFVKIFSEWELHKKEVFERHALEVRVVREEANLYSPKNVTGTLVRELICSKRNWRDFVPPGTQAVILKRPNR